MVAALTGSRIYALLFYITYATASIPSTDAPTTAPKAITVYNHSEDGLGSGTMMKRIDSARMTWYEVGLGACGHTNYDTEWVVALNAEQWNGGSHCDRQLTIYYGSKVAVAGIVDMCPGCPYGGLDLSPSLFSHLSNLDDGVFYASWAFKELTRRSYDDST